MRARLAVIVLVILCALGALAGAAVAAKDQPVAKGHRAQRRLRAAERACRRVHGVQRKRRCVASWRAHHSTSKPSHTGSRSGGQKGVKPASGQGGSSTTTRTGGPGSPTAAGTGGPGSPTAAGGSSLTPTVPAEGLPESAPTPTVPAAPARLQVIAREYSFTLSHPEVAAGPVIIEFVNAGEDEHNLNLEAGAGESLLKVFPNTPAGRTGPPQDKSFVLRAGSYSLFCSLPMHRTLGMQATLRVQ